MKISFASFLATALVPTVTVNAWISSPMPASAAARTMQERLQMASEPVQNEDEDPSFASINSNSNSNMKNNQDEPLQLQQEQTQPDLVTSRQPHQLSNGKGAFLGFRSVKGFREQARKSGTALNLSTDGGALMPDGGLSPCVIRVLGVGGGGCNAVRILLPCIV